MANYLCMWEITPTMHCIVLMSAKIFDGLEPALQQAMLRAGRDITVGGWHGAIPREDVLHQRVEASRVEVIRPEPAEVVKFGALMRPVYEAWLERAGPLGPAILARAAELCSGPASKMAAELAAAAK